MRIIAGNFKGRKLFAYSTAKLRPTSEKVKEALFNILAPQIEDASFLDLYAGSGSIGIEAVSRGAKQAVFVENNRQHLLLLKKNISLLPSREQVPIVESSVLDFLKRNKTPFDLIFLDPPYEDDLEGLLQTLAQCDTIGPDSLVIVEHFHKKNIPDQIGDLSLLRRYPYGGTALSFYVRK